MSAQRVPNPGARRDQARARLRTLTNATLLAATGATAGIAVVVAHEHPGKSSAGASGTTTSGQSANGSTGTTGTNGTTGTTGSSEDDSGGSSTSGNTGNSGSSSSSPSVSSQTPAVTSGGSGHR